MNIQKTSLTNNTIHPDKKECLLSFNKLSSGAFIEGSRKNMDKVDHTAWDESYNQLVDFQVRNFCIF